MKVKTEQLKELVGKAIQGAGNNKLAPITQMMNISVKNKRIKIITTNSVDYLYITGPIEGKDELYVTVYA